MSNNAAMREALLAIDRNTDLLDIAEDLAPNLHPSHSFVAVQIRKVVRDALAKPPRNCDVGTSEEQARRFDAFCAAHMFQVEKCCSSCPCHGAGSCEFKWGQLPYEVKGGNSMSEQRNSPRKECVMANESKGTEDLVHVVYEMWQHPETAEYASRVLNAAYRLVEDVKKSVNEAWEAGLDYAAKRVLTRFSTVNANHEKHMEHVALAGHAQGIGELLDSLRSGDVPPHKRDEELLRYVADKVEEAVKNSTDKSVVLDWYVNSVSKDDQPVWTEKHIDELFEDFYLVPRTKEGKIEQGDEK